MLQMLNHSLNIYVLLSIQHVNVTLSTILLYMIFHSVTRDMFIYMLFIKTKFLTIYCLTRIIHDGVTSTYS